MRKRFVTGGWGATVLGAVKGRAKPRAASGFIP